MDSECSDGSARHTPAPTGAEQLLLSARSQGWGFCLLPRLLVATATYARLTGKGAKRRQIAKAAFSFYRYQFPALALRNHKEEEE